MKAQIEDVRVNQSSVLKANNRLGTFAPFFAKILVSYSDRYTCDIETLDGLKMYNVPVLTKVGLINDEIYGQMEMPEPGDYVLIMFAGPSTRMKVIVGTISAYLNPKYQSSQVAVNSSSKAFTKKLFEANKNKTFRKIFKSGATLEVFEDGTVIIETPSGSYLRIKASVDEINLSGDTKTLVKFSDLKTAIQNLVSSYNSHTHTDPQGGFTGTPLPQQTLSMDSSEATKVKTS